MVPRRDRLAQGFNETLAATGRFLVKHRPAKLPGLGPADDPCEALPVRISKQNERGLACENAFDVYGPVAKKLAWGTAAGVVVTLAADQAPLAMFAWTGTNTYEFIVGARFVEHVGKTAAAVSAVSGLATLSILEAAAQSLRQIRTNPIVNG